jgi:uncharacterized iron-regulated protein
MDGISSQTFKENQHMSRYIILFITLGGLIMLIAAGCTTVPKQLSISDSGQTFDVNTIVATGSQNALDFDQLVKELKDTPIIFIGEIHNSADHHGIQLRLIRKIFKGAPNMSVGMEMFDRSYQPVLERWSRGAINEKELVRNTHWYANWRFDFSLYQDILAFIRENQIPLHGLDLPTYIPGRLRVGGLESLSSADRKWLPSEIPSGDADHRDFMERTFNQHHFLGRTTNFEDFYMAQCARDATMASAIADAMGEGPMVVLIGNGHIRHGNGVPRRVKEQTGKSYKTVYLAPVGELVSLQIADYIWVTPEAPGRPRHR